MTQGRISRILGLSNEAYALDHTEWQTASEDTIARISMDGRQRQRRQVPFASLSPLEQAYPLHCDSEFISLKGQAPFLSAAPQTTFDNEPVCLTMYAWSLQVTDDKILEGIRFLNQSNWRL